MDKKKQFDRNARDAEKAASRQADTARFEKGEDPVVLQRKNSIFPEGFFENASIENLSEAIGR